MPFYSREICDEVTRRNDIVDVIGGYVRLEKRSGRYFGLCPFHTEKTGSFSVNPDMQVFHCFGCGESGNVVSFVMKYESLGFTEAIEALAERVGMQITSSVSDDGSARRRVEGLLAANKAAAEYYFKFLRSPEGEIGLKYFKERGLSKSVLTSFGLGYTGRTSDELYRHLKSLDFSDDILKDAGLIVFDEKRGIRDRFFNRVMFPIMDVNNRVIAFGGRVMGDGQPKYLNSAESPIFNKSKTLYGLFAAKRTRFPAFILCEGYMDVISAHQAGFDNAVATLGTALTEGHATIIKRYKKPVVLCYDSDGAGRAAAARGYEILRSAGISAKIMDMSPYKDPDELIKACGAGEFEKRFREAKNAFMVIRRWEYENVDHGDPDAMTAFTQDLATRISAFTDESERENYITTAALEFSMDRDILRRKVNTIGNRSFMAPPPVRPREASGARKRSEHALSQAEGSLLYFLLEDDFYGKCSGLVERQDFSQEGFGDIYDRIVMARKSGESLKAADVINIPEDEAVKTILAQSFFTAEEQSEDRPAYAKVKKMTLLRVKKASIKRQSEGIDPQDTKGLQESLEYARETIDDIEKIVF